MLSCSGLKAFQMTKRGKLCTRESWSTLKTAPSNLHTQVSTYVSVVHECLLCWMSSHESNITWSCPAFVVQYSSIHQCPWLVCYWQSHPQLITAARIWPDSDKLSCALRSAVKAAMTNLNSSLVCSATGAKYPLDQARAAVKKAMSGVGGQGKVMLEDNFDAIEE